MGISEEKMKIVINNYFKSECNVNTSIREAFEKGFRIGVKKGLAQSKADTPQTETKMKTQNSNLTFEKRTMRDCYNCKRYETEGECIECHYEPKDEPQADCSWGAPDGEI